ncbi:MAG: hypothetical protein GY767_06595 [Shimia sp.]|nr:hypothetical protein [Shimia sp.]
MTDQRPPKWVYAVSFKGQVLAASTLREDAERWRHETGGEVIGFQPDAPGPQAVWAALAVAAWAKWIADRAMAAAAAQEKEGTE